MDFNGDPAGAAVKNIISKNGFGSAAAPGTCGELVQGVIRGEPFLVSCPVDLWSEVSVQLSTAGTPVDYLDKSYKAMNLTLEYLGVEATGISMVRKTNLPEGKGMASSTADIAAACLATARACGKTLTPDLIARIAARVEPSDGLMFPGITIVNHLNGEPKRYLGQAPPLELVIADPGGSVDSVLFNCRRDLASKNFQKEPMVRQALELVTRGLLTKDWEMMGRGATISAQANQVVLPKPYLSHWRQLASEFRALGVLVAHSGTIMGMILAPGCNDAREIVSFLKSKNPDWGLWHTKMIGGGLK